MLDKTCYTLYNKYNNSYRRRGYTVLQMPVGKFISTVNVGEKGQIVIPKGARDLFGIKPGDTLVLMADTERGIALVQSSSMEAWMSAALGASEEPEK